MKSNTSIKHTGLLFPEILDIQRHFIQIHCQLKFINIRVLLCSISSWAIKSPDDAAFPGNPPWLIPEFSSKPLTPVQIRKQWAQANQVIWGKFNKGAVYIGMDTEAVQYPSRGEHLPLPGLREQEARSTVLCTVCLLDLQPLVRPTTSHLWSEPGEECPRLLLSSPAGVPYWLNTTNSQKVKEPINQYSPPRTLQVWDNGYQNRAPALPLHFIHFSCHGIPLCYNLFAYFSVFSEGLWAETVSSLILHP